MLLHIALLTLQAGKKKVKMVEGDREKEIKMGKKQHC